MECVDCILGDRTGIKNDSDLGEIGPKKGQWLMFPRCGHFKEEIR